VKLAGFLIRKLFHLLVLDPTVSLEKLEKGKSFLAKERRKSFKDFE